MKSKRISSFTWCLFFSALSIMAIGLTVSCSKEEHDLSTHIEQNANVDIFGDYGRFIVINETGKDTVSIKDGGHTEQLKAKNGDSISIAFEAKDEYKSKDFTSKYTMYNDTIVEDKLSHQFKVEKVEAGKEYNVLLWIKPKNVDVAAKGTSRLILQIVD